MEGICWSLGARIVIFVVFLVWNECVINDEPLACCYILIVSTERVAF